MRNYKLPAILSALYTIISVTLAALFYNQLPARIPIHWNADGIVDNWGDKWVIWILAALPLLMMGLFILIPKIDPRKDNYKLHKKAYGFTIIGITTFMFLLFIATFVFMLGFEVNISMLIPGLVGGLFIILGNVMPTIKHNYTLGIKTPWTLANETVWKKTHQTGGIAFIGLGLLLIGTVFLEGTLKFVLLLSGVLGVVLFLFLYSYIKFKKIEK